VNVFIDGRYGSSKEEKESKRISTLYAEQVCGVDAGHDLIYVSDLGDLVTKLRRYKEIDRLVFCLHGVRGSFLLGGQEVPLHVVSTAFNQGNKSRPTVTQQVNIASCSVAEVPQGLVALANCFQAPLIDGFTWYHYIGARDIPVAEIKGNNNEQSLTQAIQRRNRALVPYRTEPHLSADQLLARSGANATVLFEWYRAELIFETEEPTPQIARTFKRASDAMLMRATPGEIVGTVVDRDFAHIEVHMNL
jgi:hypothetical protein